MKAINRAMKLIRDKGLKPARVEQDLGLSNGYFATMEKRQGNIGGGDFIRGRNKQIN